MLEMILALMNLWEIVDDSKELLSNNTNAKVKKEYQKCVKKALYIIRANLVEYQLPHIKGCKGLAKAWKMLCNIHQTRNLLHILFT